jgi:hypothetical protein
MAGADHAAAHVAMDKRKDSLVRVAIMLTSLDCFPPDIGMERKRIQ